MKKEMHGSRFLVIVGDNSTETENTIYCDTATEAAMAAGCEPWDNMFQARAIEALEPGDELSLFGNASVIRITGVDYNYHG